MSYKSLLTIITDPKGKAPHLDGALELARREDAHLDVLGVSATLGSR